MSLTPGTRVGPSEVSDQIDADGIPGLCRATDTQRKRQALKVLPEAVATRGRLLVPFGLLVALGTACAPGLTAIHLADRRGAPADLSMPLQTIAFGSCSRTTLPQPLWAPIRAAEPDLWIWLGDNVYGDTDDMAILRAKYEAQLKEPGYAALRVTTPVIGTWDDHDYGANNAGADYPARQASQREALDFLGEPPDSPRRRRAGLYTSYAYGEPPRKTKIILLDTRYHRGPPDADSGVLGEEQWAWLEAELAGSDAQLHIIGGGFQFLPVDHPFEKWANFGSDRARLLEVIGRSRAPGVILLSGDRHISEIMKVEDAAVNYPLYEVTSSGMTHSWADNPGEENRFRVGELYTQLGFGVLQIDWEAGSVDLQLRDPEGAVAVRERVLLSHLRRGGASGAGLVPDALGDPFPHDEVAELRRKGPVGSVK